ncbi:DUF4232 domain-containing protein [Streptomyces sp. CB01201]|uniref:DUF4232 domain-containing protein n=1 Tax=Streptomyces sp. CB01201 TaxID=2020324 RepID=UPI001F3CA446|nr:DUF4232 domain-containing protein [Streptomyces sp. CB01201]
MRTNFRTAAAATTTLVAALALTACGGGSGAGDAKAGDKPAASSAAAPSSGDSQAPAATDSAGATAEDSGWGSGTGKSGSGSSGAGSSGAGSGRHAATPAKADGKPAKKPSSGGGIVDTPCTGANVKLTATPVTRPINHILLTVTNTGKTLCNAYTAPSISFSKDAQSPIQIDRSTIPQAVVTLSPGASAYAMVRTLGEDDGGKAYKADHVTVYFHGRSGNESTGPSAYAALSKSVAVVDSQAMATYWQSDLSTIDSW